MNTNAAAVFFLFGCLKNKIISLRHESDANRMMYFSKMFSGASVCSGQVTIKSPSVCPSAARGASRLRHPAEIFFRKQAKFLLEELFPTRNKV